MSIDQLWYQKNILSYLLLPFSWLYRSIISIRRTLYRLNLKKTTHFPVPIIVIGNITVGGTGKTPLVIYLAEYLKQQGWRPGIVSRGYGGHASLQSVKLESDPRQVGDEPLLLAQKTGCPMVIGKDRVAAVKMLLAQSDCNIILSDDGLQHLALGRDLEIAVIDGQRRHGNGFCLPAGPLREPVSRLKTVDFIVSNGPAKSGEWPMQLVPSQIYSLINPTETLTPQSLQGQTIHAVAGIGNPQRFFKTLTDLGFKIIPHAFPDHYAFQAKDIDFGPDATVIMTEKDATKCHSFADSRHWALAIHAELPIPFLEQLRSLL